MNALDMMAMVERGVAVETKPCSHEPDWDSISTQWDGDEEYVDVCCKHCGRTGSLGGIAKLVADVDWEEKD